MGSSSSSFATKQCACPSVEFLARVISLSADSNDENETIIWLCFMSTVALLRPLAFFETELYEL